MLWLFYHNKNNNKNPNSYHDPWLLLQSYHPPVPSPHSQAFSPAGILAEPRPHQARTSCSLTGMLFPLTGLCSNSPWKAFLKICWRWKIIFLPPFWVLGWNPSNKRQINKRKTKRGLLTCIPRVYLEKIEKYLEVPREKLATPWGGFELRLKYHLNKERGWEMKASWGRVKGF